MTQRTGDLISVYEHGATELEQRITSGAKVIDTFEDQAREYAEIHSGDAASPRYVYFPWHNMIVKTLDPIAFVATRTNRNHNLITEKEQRIFADSHIAFAGLNVGNPGALCIAHEGGSRTMSFADPDHLSLSNLNRFRASVADIGVNKAVLTARQVLEIDPYYTLIVEPEGVSNETLGSFLDECDLLIEEMDVLPLKIAIRDAARERGIPVVMVTGNGPGVIIDIERYDLDAKTPILNGNLDKDTERIIRSDEYTSLPLSEKIVLARDFMGSMALHPRLISSFEQVGTSLIGIPQLAESSFIRGAAICHAARMVLTGTIASGRYSVSLEDTMHSFV